MEDLIQEVMMRLVCAERHGVQLNGTYIYKTCRSVVVDYLRTRPPSQCELPDRECDGQHVEARVLLHLWYKECLHCLPEEERSILQAHLEQNLSFLEIAEGLSRQAGLKMTCECVKKRYQRAIARLRDWLQRGGRVKE